MATFSGTSINGIQGLGNFAATGSSWVAIDFPTLDINNRLERVGLLILSGINPGSRAQVVEVVKLFGNGCFFLPRYPILPFTYNLSVDWYRSGLQWQASTP